MAANTRPVTAPVNKIIPFSNVDGPGNRAAVFLQGCGYTCHYCHNPETIRLCVDCGDCIPGCPAGALKLQDGKMSWDQAVCIDCDACIAVCKHFSSPKVRLMTAEMVMDELSDALPFLTGLTTSGGECTIYDAFLCELFTLAKGAGKHTLVDTNGQRLFSDMPELLALMDGASLDVKTIDPAEHLTLTGAPVDRVLTNLDLLAKAGKLYEVRTVIVPERLDNHRTIREVAQRIAAYPDVRYKLIRFRPYGVRGEWQSTSEPRDELMEELAAIARACGVGVVELV